MDYQDLWIPVQIVEMKHKVRTKLGEKKKIASHFIPFGISFTQILGW